MIMGDFMQQPPTPENLRRIGWTVDNRGCDSPFGFGYLTVEYFAEKDLWRIWNGGYVIPFPAPATMGDLIAGLRFLGIPCEVANTMTYDEWKAALLPMGWRVEGSRYLCSPMGPRSLDLIIEQDGDELVLYLPLQRIPMPPDLVTMRALMTGLQIPTTPSNTPGGQGESHE